MSTSHNVNRVNSGFDIEAEKAKLAGSTPVWDTPQGQAIIDKAVSEAAVDLGTLAANTVNEAQSELKVEESDKLLEQDPITLKLAWNQLTNSFPVDIVDQSSDEITNSVDHDALSQLRALVGGDDLKVFRGQVIKALKHIGLDTKKFFGE